MIHIWKTWCWHVLLQSVRTSPLLFSHYVLFQADGGSNCHNLRDLSGPVHPSVPAVHHKLDCRSHHQRHHRCSVSSSTFTPFPPEVPRHIVAVLTGVLKPTTVTIVTVSTILVIVKLEVARRKRKQMSNSQSQTSAGPIGGQNHQNVAVCLHPLHHIYASRDNRNSDELSCTWVWCKRVLPQYVWTVLSGRSYNFLFDLFC